MAQFTASVVFTFVDKMSGASRKAFAGMRSGIDSVKSSIADLANGSKYLQSAANLSLVAQQFSSMTQSVAAIVDKPSQVAAAFETGMARVSIVLTSTNAIGGDVARTQETIANAARDMAGGMTEASKVAALGMDEFASSVYTMLSSGLQSEQAIAATNQAAILAKATGGNLADAASAITGVFNNLGDKSADATTEMTRLSDVIAGTQNYFAFENLSQFTDGLKNVSGAAIGFGVPLEQVAASIGQLNTNMITGTQAGTAIKSVLAQMANASKRLGFDIVNTDSGGVDLLATLTNIAKTGADGAAMTRAFGTEAGPAVSILTENLKELKDGFDAVQNSAGVTLSNAAKMAETLTEKQLRLSKATEVFQQRMGAGANAVKGFGTDLAFLGVQTLNFLSDLPLVGDAFSSLAGAFTQGGSFVFGFANSILQMSTGLASFMWLGEKMPVMLKAAKGAFGLLRSGILTAIPTLLSWTAGMYSAAAAHLAAFGWIYAIVAALAAVGIGIYALIKHWSSVWNVMKAIGAWIIDVFLGTWNAITSVISFVYNTIASLFDNTLIATLGALFAPFITIPALIIKYWRPIADFFSNTFSSIAGGIKSAGSFIASFFGLGNDELATVPARFNGGGVLPNTTYLVGEKGPELFTPRTSGHIIPNSKTNAIFSGSQQTMNKTVNIHISGVQVHVPQQNGAQAFIDSLLEIAEAHAS